jgi:iron complex transport system substrate-binding protein
LLSGSISKSEEIREYMMDRKLILVAIVLLAFTGSYLGKKAIHESGDGISDVHVGTDSQDHDRKQYRQIVSLAPSITETLFALGLGDRVAGVTCYRNFPPEARTKANVGGYYDPNYEAIVALHPDLIILFPEHEAPRQHLSKLGLNMLVVDHKSISGILTSITAIGKTCGADKKAESIVRDLQVRMERIRQKTDGLPRLRIMISVGRNTGSGTLEDVYISGKDGFYDKMITLAGGVNAYAGDVAFPVVSRETIIRMNPEVIIDMIPDIDKKGWDKAMILKEWNAVSQVDAVSKGRVYVFGKDYVVIPGPRFILILEDMARVIHPEVD